MLNTEININKTTKYFIIDFTFYLSNEKPLKNNKRATGIILVARILITKDNII
ncbi:hypothetical protein MASR1M45_19170 [Candidatus Kapaibacterium sp.]